MQHEVSNGWLYCAMDPVREPSHSQLRLPTHTVPTHDASDATWSGRMLASAAYPGPRALTL